MQATESFFTVDDGLKLFSKNWTVKNPRAVIFLVHGFGEHCRRYEHFAAFWQKNQVAVIGYDRRGHGSSEGKRGHTPSFDNLLDEVAYLIGEGENLYPGVPKILYGHSQGGNIVLNYLIKRNPEIAAAVVTGAWIQLAFQPPAVMVFLGKLMNAIFPKFSQPNQLNPDHLSRDKKVGADYMNDPLVHRSITARMGMEMLKSAAFLDEYSGEIKVPLLMMHGEKDQIISPSAAKTFSERVSGDVTFKMWTGLFHEIHNEPEQNEVFGFTLDWLEKKKVLKT